MGAPLVRQDDLTRAEKKLNAKINKVKREIREEVIEYLGSLGLTGPAEIATVTGIEADEEQQSEEPAAAPESPEAALFGEES